MPRVSAAPRWSTKSPLRTSCRAHSTGLVMADEEILTCTVFRDKKAAGALRARCLQIPALATDEVPAFREIATILDARLLAARRPIAISRRARHDHGVIVVVVRVTEADPDAYRPRLHAQVLRAGRCRDARRGQHRRETGALEPSHRSLLFA